MSTELIIRLFPQDAKYATTPVISGAVQAVSNWDKFGGNWSRYGAEIESSPAQTTRCGGPLGTQEVLQLIGAAPPSQFIRHLARASFSCWRWDAAISRMVEGEGTIDVRAWGPQTRAVRYGLLAMEGNAEISIQPANPYWALLDESDSRGANYNPGVKNNLNALGTLLLLLATGTSPYSLKLFVDQGERLPFNAHVVYYSSPSAVLADMELIYVVWERGIEGTPATPPLENFDEAKHRFAFSELRSADDRRRLWEDFRTRIPKMRLVTTDAVTRALELTSVSIQRLNEGFIVCNHPPYFLNSFVDTFYLDVIDSI